MPRPTWTSTEEQRQALAAVDELAAAARDADEALWKAIDAAKKLRVPAEVLAEHVGVSRATLYRRLGETDPDSDEGASTS